MFLLRSIFQRTILIPQMSAYRGVSNSTPYREEKIVTNEDGSKNIVIKWSQIESDSDIIERPVVTEDPVIRRDVQDTEEVDDPPVVEDTPAEVEEPKVVVSNEDLEQSNSSIKVKRGTHILECFTKFIF